MFSGRINPITVIVLVILMVTTTAIHTVHSAVFSGPLEDFIKEGKKVEIIFRDELKELSFTAREEVKFYDLDGQSSGRLLKGEVYQISLGEEERETWEVQVFAAAEQARAEEIRDRLSGEGYEDAYLVRAEGLFKVRIGKFIQEKTARELADKLENEGWSSWVLSVPGVPAGGIEMKVHDGAGRLVFSGRRLKLSGSISLEQGIYPGQTEFSLIRGGIRVCNLASFSQVLMGLLVEKNRVRNENDLEMLKALAVAVRTELLYRLTEGSGGQIDDPEYQGLAGLGETIRTAVLTTTGEVLKKEGELVPAVYIPTGVSRLAEQGAEYRTILSELNPGGELVDLSQTTREEVLVEAAVFPGLKYRELSQLSWWGPRVITILDLDLEREGFVLEPVLAGGRIRGLGDLNDLVRENRALAGINGGFYSYTGSPLGLLIKEGVMVSEPIRARAAFGITGEGDILIDRVDWRGYLVGEDGNRIRINGVNRAAGNNEIIIYNNFYAEQAPVLKEGFRELLLVNNRVSTLREGPDSQGSIIPPEGLIVQAAGDKAELLGGFVPGSEVILENNFLPDWEEEGVVAAIGAGPLLIKEGRIWITADEEGFQPDISSGRAPRSALGITPDRRLIIVTVDGRQPEASIGMTLEELAELLLDLGVKAALNLDGGSSARMVVRGFTMNNPTRERLLSNGLLINNIYAR